MEWFPASLGDLFGQMLAAFVVVGVLPTLIFGRRRLRTADALILVGLCADGLAGHPLPPDRGTDRRGDRRRRPGTGHLADRRSGGAWIPILARLAGPAIRGRGRLHLALAGLLVALGVGISVLRVSPPAQAAEIARVLPSQAAAWLRARTRRGHASSTDTSGAATSGSTSRRSWSSWTGAPTSTATTLLRMYVSIISVDGDPQVDARPIRDRPRRLPARHAAGGLVRRLAGLGARLRGRDRRDLGASLMRRDLAILFALAIVTRAGRRAPGRLPALRRSGLLPAWSASSSPQATASAPRSCGASWRSAAGCRSTPSCRSRATATGCRSPRSWRPARSPSSATPRIVARRRAADDRDRRRAGAVHLPASAMELWGSRFNGLGGGAAGPHRRAAAGDGAPGRQLRRVRRRRGRRHLVLDASRSRRRAPARGWSVPAPSSASRRWPGWTGCCSPSAPAVAWAVRRDWTSWWRPRRAGASASAAAALLVLAPVAGPRPGHLRQRPSRRRAATPSGSRATTSSSRSGRIRRWPPTWPGVR